MKKIDENQPQYPKNFSPPSAPTPAKTRGWIRGYRMEKTPPYGKNPPSDLAILITRGGFHNEILAEGNKETIF